MAVYYQNFDMERNADSDVTFRLRVEETPNIAENTSDLITAIEYRNTGSKIGNYEFSASISANGNVLIEKDFVSSNYITLLSDGEWHELGTKWLRRINTYSHDSNGGGSFTVSAEIKANEVLFVYYTKGSATVSKNYTPIDQSSPTVSDFNISADRYGLNASVSFNASHQFYTLTKVKFELKNLTFAQANNRVGKVTQADSSRFVYDAAKDSHTLVLEKASNLTNSDNIITFDLDCIDETSYPLASGGRYEYGLTVTCLNGKTLTKQGTLIVPQKVTGITCDSVINIMQGNTAQLNYTVIPTNAELQTVTFSSSDEDIATVDANGLITAKESSEAFAVALITVKTDDGEYTASCTVNVTTSAAFPYLPQVTQFLTAEHFASIIAASAIVRNELMDKGADVGALTEISVTGKNQPVLSIMPAFIAMESNCQILRSAAHSLGYSTSALPSSAQKINKRNTDWITVVNNWIIFLNNLHTTIGGG